mmetsp:Transcript_11085/g.46235  ORF Transcript_11085/g.46235 Transcript_11085/m.46235 type:complete len:231 (+) Transcript_11085:453-1145(+)
MTAVHRSTGVDEHGKERVLLHASRLGVGVGHGAGDVQRRRVLHELRQLTSAERHVFEPLELHGENQRGGVDRELLRGSRHVRLTPAHLALVLVGPVENLHGDVAPERRLDALGPGDVQGEVHERVKRVALAAARLARHLRAEPAAENLEHEGGLRPRGVLRGLGPRVIHALLMHGVQQAARELVRVLLPTLPERLGYRPQILDERARRHDPSLARQRAAHVLAHLVYRTE